MSRLVQISAQVAVFCRCLVPEQRRAVKPALKDLREERGDIRSLEGNLSGFNRLRVGRFRIIFAYRSDGAIAAVFMEERRLVYDLFEAQFIKRLKT